MPTVAISSGFLYRGSIAIFGLRRSSDLSTSLIQRRMKLGYNRAGRIMDQLSEFGIVGKANGSKPREVLMKTEAQLRDLLASKGLL